MDESTWLERFYTHFLGRDLAYTYAGGLFICVVEYALYYKVFMPQELSLELIGFVLSSYFLGTIIREIGVTVFSRLIAENPIQYKSPLIFNQFLIKNYDVRILNRYERLINNLAICTSVGTSSLLSGCFMGIVDLYRWSFQATYSMNHIGLAFSLFLLGVYMVYTGKLMARGLEEEHIALVNNIPSNIE